jgi:TRAP-type uncharacterized transport system substrate-binding protein
MAANDKNGRSIADNQAQVEGFALIISAFYNGLIRDGVPEHVAIKLTESYIDNTYKLMMAQAQAAAAKTANPADSINALLAMLGKTRANT